jgi:hypothetical protein
VLTAFFQWGWGTDAFGLGRAGPIEAFLPVVTLAILFGQRDVAEFGIGLAAAVALDAFILRTVLVPAAMHVFGNANWWLPRWLDRRLPHLAIEPTEAGSIPVPTALTQQGGLRSAAR